MNVEFVPILHYLGVRIYSFVQGLSIHVGFNQVLKFWNQVLKKGMECFFRWISKSFIPANLIGRKFCFYITQPRLSWNSMKRNMAEQGSWANLSVLTQLKTYELYHSQFYHPLKQETKPRIRVSASSFGIELSNTNFILKLDSKF